MTDNTLTHDSRAVRRVPGRNGGTLTPFDSERARAAVRAREEKRMRLYAAGAGLAVEDAALLADYGDDAHIVERAMTLQRIASTPDAGKAAVLAAAHLDKAQGLIAPAADADTAPRSRLDDAVAGLLAAMTRAIAPDDADVVDADTSDGGG